MRKGLQNSTSTPKDTLTFLMTTSKWWNFTFTITTFFTMLQMKWERFDGRKHGCDEPESESRPLMILGKTRVPSISPSQQPTVV